MDYLQIFDNTLIHDLVCRTFNQCQSYFWTKPIPLQPPMGQFPATRVFASKLFTHTGVDFDGPLMIRVGL